MKPELKIVKPETSQMTERQKKALAEIEARHQSARDTLMNNAAGVSYTVDRGGREASLEIDDIVRKATRDVDKQQQGEGK